MKFYDVGNKSHIEIAEKHVKVKKTKNNRHLAYVDLKQKRLVKFISKAEAVRLGFKN